MQRLEVSSAVRPIYGSLGVKWLIYSVIQTDGLNFVSLYFKITTSDKYDVNYI